MKRLFGLMVSKIIYFILVLSSYLRGNVSKESIGGREIKIIKNDIVVGWYGFGFGVALLEKNVIFLEENLNKGMEEFVKYHELGHLYNGHFKNKRNLNDELEADSYAFKKLFELGYSKKEIESLIREIMNRSIGSFLNSDLNKKDKNYYIEMMENERKERINNLKEMI